MTRPETFSLERYVDALNHAALTRIRIDYDNPQDPEDQLDYHSSEHTRDVIRRIQAILAIVAPQHIHHGVLAASFHDSIVMSLIRDTKVYGQPARIRMYRTGRNERESGELAALSMAATCGLAGPVFSREDIAIVQEAIPVTIPTPTEKGIAQPHLTENVHVVAKALALADLGGASIDGGQTFLDEGRRLFLERNLDIKSMLQGLSPDRLNDQAYIEAAFLRLLDFSAQQIAFAQGREGLLPYELSLFKREHRVGLASLMRHLSDSIRAARHQYVTLSKMPHTVTSMRTVLTPRGQQ